MYRFGKLSCGGGTACLVKIPIHELMCKVDVKVVYNRKCACYEIVKIDYDEEVQKKFMNNKMNNKEITKDKFYTIDIKHISEYIGGINRSKYMDVPFICRYMGTKKDNNGVTQYLMCIHDHHLNPELYGTEYSIPGIMYIDEQYILDELKAKGVMFNKDINRFVLVDDDSHILEDIRNKYRK